MIQAEQFDRSHNILILLESIECYWRTFLVENKCFLLKNTKNFSALRADSDCSPVTFWIRHAPGCICLWSRDTKRVEVTRSTPEGTLELRRLARGQSQPELG